MNTVYVLIIAIAVAFVLASRFHLAYENQRFAVYSHGKFIRFKGPGLIFKWSGYLAKWVLISIGDRGVIAGSGVCKIQGHDIPIQITESIKIGELVRITGFNENQIIVARDPNQRRSIICEKCGHENTID